MILDTRTVLHFEGFLFLVCFIILLILWFQARKRFNGLALWTGFYFLESVGFLLIGFREYVPAWASIPFANSLVAGGFIMLLLGTLRFVGKKISSLSLTGLSATLIVYIVVHTWYTFGDPNLVIRILNASLGMIFYCALTFFVFQRTEIDGSRSWSKGTRTVLILFMIVLAARIFGVMQIDTNDFMASGNYDTIMLLLSSLMVVFLAFNLILMVTHRSIEATIKTEERYSTLFGNSLNPVFIIDRNGRYVDANGAALQFLECSLLDLPGMSIRDTISPDQDEEYLMKYYRKLWEKGGTIEADYFINGQTKTLELSVTPGIQDDQHVIFLMGSDITERRQMEKSLRRSNQFLQNTQRLSKLGGWSYDVVNKVNYWTDYVYEMFGVGYDFNIDDIEHISDYFPGEGKSKILDYFTKAMNEGIPFEIELDFINAKGSFMQVRVTGQPVLENSTVIRVEGNIRNITEQKATEAREKQLQQELIAQSRLATVGQMAAGIAHEINNPLTGVIGFSSFLLDRDLPEDVKQDIRMINEGSTRVASIIKRMLTFAGQQGTEFVLTDLNELIDVVLGMRSHDMQLNNIRVVKNLDPDLPDVQVDTGQIQQVLLNVIMNAEIEMSDANHEGILTVSTEMHEGTVRITFEDNGPGIKKENIEKVFDPFFTTREVGQGTGLGLSVSYGIIANHHGNIFVDSNYREGARFVIELPLKQTMAQMKQPGDESVRTGVPKSGNILVVDDEEIVRKVLGSMLKNIGYSVTSVATGSEALTLMEANDYDAILLDIRMPDISGIDIYEKLYDISREKQKKVIFVTGDVMNQETMTYVLSAEIPHVGKPFTPAEIEKAIEKVTGSR